MADVAHLCQAIMPGEQGLYLLFVAMKDEPNRTLAAFEKMRDAVNDDFRRIIAAHGVDRKDQR
jgi:hypothetical protein